MSIAPYTKTFTKPYSDGWKDRPDTSTAVTAEILDSYDNAIENVEAYLTLQGTGFTAFNSMSLSRASNTDIGNNSVALGINNEASGKSSCAICSNNSATGDNSFSTGNGTTASASCAYSEGNGTTASGNFAHGEGSNGTAGGVASHTEGNHNIVSGDASHGEGFNNTISASNAHVEGMNNTVSETALASHTEGMNVEVSGQMAHAEGMGVKALGNIQHVQGRYNVADTANKYAHIVGAGNSDNDRKNIHTLDWQGNAEYAGTVKSAGLKLTDAATGQEYIVTVSDGSLSIAEA